MAILKNGLWGGITGKLGNTVCYMLNGKQCVRMIVKSNKPPTQKQLDNWSEMSLVNDFLRPVKELIKIGYRPLAKTRGSSEYNLAVSYIKKHALKGERPNRDIDYSKVRISQGDLPGLVDAQVILDGSMLRLSWSAGYDLPARHNDKVIALAYFPPAGAALKAMACFDLCGSNRSHGEHTLEFPPALAGRRAEVYIAVQAVNEKTVSDSQYLGTILP